MYDPVSNQIDMAQNMDGPIDVDIRSAVFDLGPIVMCISDSA